MESILPLDASTEAAVRRLYTRENPRGPSRELWRHAYGCRAWLNIQRDTATHAVLAVDLLDPPA